MFVKKKTSRDVEGLRFPIWRIFGPIGILQSIESPRPSPDETPLFGTIDMVWECCAQKCDFFLVNTDPGTLGWVFLCFGLGGVMRRQFSIWLVKQSRSGLSFEWMPP